MEKEIYIKVFDGRNRLLLVTPKLENAINLIAELTDMDLSDVELRFAYDTNRFVQGYRLIKTRI